MKQLTCSQMGGPCDAVISGNTMDEMMNNGMSHLKSMTDDAHQQALTMATTMSDEQGKEWMQKTQALFDAAPEM